MLLENWGIPSRLEHLSSEERVMGLCSDRLSPEAAELKTEKYSDEGFAGVDVRRGSDADPGKRQGSQECLNL
jgi:hypothetical protein